MKLVAREEDDCFTGKFVKLSHNKKQLWFIDIFGYRMIEIKPRVLFFSQSFTFDLSLNVHFPICVGVAVLTWLFCNVCVCEEVTVSQNSVW